VGPAIYVVLLNKYFVIVKYELSRVFFGECLVGRKGLNTPILAFSKEV